MPNNIGETETKQFVCTCAFMWKRELEKNLARFMSLQKAEYNGKRQKSINSQKINT